MGKSINKVILLGNVGDEPNIRTLQSDTKMATLRLATSERYKDKQGNWQDRTEWHNIVAYARIAEVIEKYVNKGTKLYIEGKIQTREFEDHGEKRFRTEIKVDDLVLAGAPPQRQQERNEDADWDDFK